LDGSDPASSTSNRKEMKAAAAGQTLAVSAFALPVSTPVTLRLIVFNSENGFYSNERTIEVTRVK